MAAPAVVCTTPPCTPAVVPSQFYPNMCQNKPCPPVYPFTTNPYVSAPSYASWPSYASLPSYSPSAPLPSYPSMQSYPANRPSTSSLPSLASLFSNFAYYDPSRNPSLIDPLSNSQTTTTTTSSPEETNDDTSNDSNESIF